MSENINREIRAFLENLLEEKKVNAPDALREQLILDLYQRLQQKFMQVVVKNLNPRDLKALDEIAMTGEDKVQSFLLSKIKNLNQLFKQTMVEFRQVYLEG